ncbi:MAG: hypothetical protein MSG64_20605 [Pyrinomonadaceae bacterium MAG19_C2-C3]|nr:hypothetical protein [Pyrinomonadaceae bacterium MAG19_C2-C3]
MRIKSTRRNLIPVAAVDISADTLRSYLLRRGFAALALCFMLVVFAQSSFAQTATPTPAAAGPPQQVRALSDIAVRFVPAVKRVVEGAMLKRYTFLAIVFAQLVMLAAIIRLQAEKPGATRDFFGQAGRSIILLPLILLGPWLVSYLYTLGGQLAFPLRVPLREAVLEFDDSYYRFTMGMFTATDRGGIYTPMPTGVEGIVGVLSDRDTTVRTVDQMLDPARWDMTKLFAFLNIARGILSFGEFVLVVLTGFLMIAFRLAVPWMIAMSIDRSLAHEVSYKFARGVVVYTLVFPIVAHILMIIAYKIGTLGMAIYDGTAMYNVDPQTAQLIARPDVDPTFCFGIAVFMMAVAALCFVAAPVLSWKIAFGQTFEGVATVASGWMAAIVGSGINFVSAKVGATLNNMAERLQVDTHANAGLTTARADLGATTQTNAAGLHNQLGQIAAARTGQVMSNNAASQKEQTNLLAAYRNSIANVQINKGAQFGLIEADRALNNRGVSNQTAREQAQILINQQTATNTNDQSWWTWGTEALGGVAGAAATKGQGTAAGTSVGSLASRPGAIMTDKLNIETQTMGNMGVTSDYLGRTAESNRDYEGDRKDVETLRAEQMQGALTTQYQEQQGAVGTWSSQVNTAANVQAQMSSTAARESTGMLNEAAQTKFAGSQSAIEQVRSAGLQAAEWHRMAQIIGQVTHDMTRRIEEMGQYRF